MGYGGAAIVDVIQTDIEAIIDGICGPSVATLTDLFNLLIGMFPSPLHDGSMGVVDWLNDISGYMQDVKDLLGGAVTGPLYDGNLDVVGWLSAVYDRLANIQAQLDGQSFGNLYDGSSSAVNYLYNIDSALSEVITLLYQFSFDVDGRLKVTTS